MDRELEARGGVGRRIGGSRWEVTVWFVGRGDPFNRRGSHGKEPRGACLHPHPHPRPSSGQRGDRPGEGSPGLRQRGAREVPGALRSSPLRCFPNVPPRTLLASGSG